MRRLLLLVLIALVLLGPLAARSAAATVNPLELALGPSDLPPGAVVTRQRLDRTAAAVNSEHIFGLDDTTGNEYVNLHFIATLAERALLPRFNGTEHAVFMLATIFRSASAATRAYSADSSFATDACADSPTIASAVPVQTCVYKTKSRETGMYVIGTAGPYEFALVAYVHATGAAALDRIVHDASFVAVRESTRILRLLVHRATGARPSSSRTHRVPPPTVIVPPPVPPATATPPPATATPPPATATQAPTVPPATNTPPLPQVGDALDVTLSGHSWRLSVTKVQTASTVSDSLFAYRAQGKYVLVFVTATNEGSDPASLFLDQDFQLEDSRGLHFSLASSAPDTTAEDQFNLTDSASTTQPSFTIRTVFLFDVALDARSLYLQNAPLLGQPDTLFDLGI